MFKKKKILAIDVTQINTEKNVAGIEGVKWVSTYSVVYDDTLNVKIFIWLRSRVLKEFW